MSSYHIAVDRAIFTFDDAPRYDNFQVGKRGLERPRERFERVWAFYLAIALSRKTMRDAGGREKIINC